MGKPHASLVALGFFFFLVWLVELNFLLIFMADPDFCLAFTLALYFSMVLTDFSYYVVNSALHSLMHHSWYFAICLTILISGLPLLA